MNLRGGGIDDSGIGRERVNQALAIPLVLVCLENWMD